MLIALKNPGLNNRKSKPALLILAAVFVTFTSVLYAQKAGEWGALEPLPADVLAFAPFGKEYEKRIESSSGSYRIYSQTRLNEWALAQGFEVQPDNNAGGWQYKRAGVFRAPGVFFSLYLPEHAVQARLQTGWKLVIDAGFLKPTARPELLSSDYKFYENILRADIFIDGIFYETVETGFGRTNRGLLVYHLPFVRDPAGKVNVEVRLANHPSNFFILYDAFLTR